MANKFVWGMVLILLCVCVPQALALGSYVEVTKATQAEVGLTYTITATHTSANMVEVRMEIPKKGKLKKLRSVGLSTGQGSPSVSATLQMWPEKRDSVSVVFQLSADLADKCSLSLNVPSTQYDYTIYAVQLKGYILNNHP